MLNQAPLQLGYSPVYGAMNNGPHSAHHPLGQRRPQGRGTAGVNPRHGDLVPFGLLGNADHHFVGYRTDEQNQQIGASQFAL